MKAIKLLSTAAVAAVMLLGLAPAASAADHSMYTNDDGGWQDPAGLMWFNEYGDVVTLCDNDADGHAPSLTVALYHPYHATRYRLTAWGGEGNCVTARASDGGVFNLPEHTNIGFQICISPHGGMCRNATWYNDQKDYT
ncbi:hypothetical protein [Georgenia subflava]|uniref:Secreted protein n=1 Tax=Georgenia subflava TaxID=1622177 RepID=A0A6N7EHU9_9MICO|nr:hypothetical protein [Georgenia subflava]MPV36215.1 hypothetical protein [Georgenia subflava]